ncbi:MAG: hypothetical protein JEZ00_18350 [Anaerolineaceae bacterium]|nr:hypothetical protein [Anaerolineaceae bacterium]
MKYDSKLTRQGKQRDTAIKKALNNQKGRTTKEEWAKHIGTDLKIYNDSKKHLSYGVSYVLSKTSSREIQEARKAANAYALARAKNALQCLGKKKPTSKEAQAAIAQQDRQIQQLNLIIAKNIAKMREYIDQDKEAEKELLLKQILHRHAEKESGEKLPGEPKKPSTAEELNKTHQYYHFLNRAKV